MQIQKPIFLAAIFASVFSLNANAACPCEFKKFRELEDCKLLHQFKPESYACVGWTESEDTVPVVFYGKTGKDRPDRCSVRISGMGEVTVRNYAVEEPSTIQDCFINLKASYSVLNVCKTLRKIPKIGPAYYVCLDENTFASSTPNPKAASSAVLNWGAERGGQLNDLCSVQIKGIPKFTRDRLTSQQLKDCFKELTDIAQEPTPDS